MTMIRWKQVNVHGWNAWFYNGFKERILALTQLEWAIARTARPCFSWLFLEEKIWTNNCFFEENYIEHMQSNSLKVSWPSLYYEIFTDIKLMKHYVVSYSTSYTSDSCQLEPVGYCEWSYWFHKATGVINRVTVTTTVITIKITSMI